MIGSFIKIAFRNLRKHLFFSLINIFGLAIGLTAFILVLEYVSFELSFDRFNENGKDIYRVINDRYQNGELIQHGTITYSAVGPQMKDDFPEIINNAIVVPTRRVIGYSDNMFKEDSVLIADHSFLDMFSYEVLAGTLENALEEPYSIILTKSIADKIFANEFESYDELINKSLQLGGDNQAYAITAVLKDVPANSHLQFNVLLPYSKLRQDWKDADRTWTGSSDFWHYIQLRPGTDYLKVESELEDFTERHLHGNEVTGSVEKFYLQPLYKAHLFSDYEYEIGVIGSSLSVFGMTIIAFFIMLIAWINFINLSTVRATDRAREVGIRKVVGAGRRLLIFQFMSESFLINVFSLILALTTVQFIQPFYNGLVELPLSIRELLGNGFGGINTTIGLIVFFLSGVFLSGFYPSFLLSAFKPVEILKGKVQTTGRSGWIRKGLIIFQFIASITLIAIAFIVYKQVRFMQTKNLGLNIDQTLVISGPSLTRWDSTFIDRMSNFKQDLLKFPNIIASGTSQRMLGNTLGRAFDARTDYTDPDSKLTISWMGVDNDFVEMFEMELIAGQKLTFQDHNYKFGLLKNLMLNQSAVETLGFPDPVSAIGERVFIYGKEWIVKGVVKDFHNKSLQFPVEPIAIQPLFNPGGQIYAKLSTGNLQNTIKDIEGMYKQYFPGNPFEYAFLDDHFNSLYKSERQFGKIFSLFTILAIFIACLGLFGLTSFSVIKRSKEIGIRKIIGASVFSIVSLLSSESLKLLLYASVLAIPISYFSASSWLDNFAFKVDLTWWYFALPVIVILAIALISVTYQTN